MIKVSKKGINRLILRTVLEMVMIVLAVVMSYMVFTSSNLASSAAIANAYSTSDYDFQTSFSRSSDNMNEIMTSSNLLDKGELLVRNPNRTEKEVKMVMVIEEGWSVNLDELEIKVNDETVDLSKKTIEGSNYIIELNDTSIGAYENYRGVIALYGNPLGTNNFNYSFQITENL